ncbi:MAG: DUF721 domain-containing protein [Rhodospirillales bacterium]|nr:DUF721 domain-containing protein [Rhodospirillales bacterium]
MSLRALGATLPKITRATLARRGTVFAALVGEWPAIVGPELAAATLPEKFSAPPKDAADPAGTLTLRVAGGVAMEVQHLAPQIVERINAFLGWRAVGRLKLFQAPVSVDRRPVATPPPQPTPQQAAAIDAAVADVDNVDLKQALTRLGRLVLGREKSDK